MMHAYRAPQFNAAGNAYANYTQYWTRKMLDIKYNLNADVRLSVCCACWVCSC